MVEPSAPKAESSLQTIIFMVILSFICAFILASLASILAVPKEVAKDLDRSKQLLIAAKILSHNGYFTIFNEQGKVIPAKFEEGKLIPGTEENQATQEQILDLYKNNVKSFLVNGQGEEVTFRQAGIDETEYVTNYKKSGYYKQPLKLIYEILSPIAKETDEEGQKPVAYVIPVNGLGLWDAIYGYLAIKPDGNTVIGTSWYDQKETPGLGANISEPDWQSYFPEKKIFQPLASGETDFKTAPLGITVVKGKVRDVLGDSPKSKSAVDGMTGATLTGNGVTDAFREVLAAYRPFFIRLIDQKKN